MLKKLPIKTDYPADYDELITIKDLPVAAINQESFFTFVNKAFEDTYGWQKQEVIGRGVTNIMPEHMRNMHMIGFSRFLASEEPRLIGKPVPVKLLSKSSEIMDVELFILGKKNNGIWKFAAIIKPINSKK